jgi:translation initiation factor IF-2
VLKSGETKTMKKKRIYQVAKEFNISNEALIDFLREQNFKARNHMAPLTDEMYAIVCQNYQREEVETSKEPDYKRRIQEKREEEEARRQAVLHEIDEILERSKGDVFEPVEVISRTRERKKRKPKEEAVPEVPVEAEADEAKEKVQKKVVEAKKEKKKKAKKEAEAVIAEKPTEEEKVVAEKRKRHLKRRIKPEKKAEEAVAEKAEAVKEAAKKKKRRKRKKDEAVVEEVAEEVAAYPKKKKRRRKKKKPAVKIDEKEIEASIKETLAKMSETPKRKRRKKEKDVEEVIEEEENVIRTTEFTSVAELANLMNVEASEVIQACISLGLMVTINQRLDRDTILMVADEFDYDVKFLTEYGEEHAEKMEEEEEDEALLEPRPPVVTIMGHVDHGKTSLLDYIRESNIIAGESGGITQHIGAYEVTLDNKKITFLDTPGHEAFTAMRARGAQVTDIVILVVAADDDVMPQTIEAINHARAAGVPIVVAINKIDKPNANVDLIKQKLSEQNILVEAWGGKVQSAEVSAKTGEGIDHLLEIILLEAEILELKANPSGHARAVMIEARMDKGRGIVGTALVQKGTLEIGDSFVAGKHNGRVRAMFDERNHSIDEAPPSTPVQILGFNGMPQAGDIISVVDSEQEAREISLKRQQLSREQSFRQLRRLTLDQISKRIAEGYVKELSVIIKADVDGSMEAISDSLMELGKEEDVAVRIIHKGVGTITESDVLLAEASQAVILGFHVTPNVQAKELAQKEKIDIRLYKVIYDIVNDVKLALSGLLEPEISEEVVGSVEVREVFKASKIGLIAGCYVLSGKITRNTRARVIRDDKVIHEGKIASLKRFKDDVKEVASGYECGITLEDFKDILAGDVLEVYQIVETARTL